MKIGGTASSPYNLKQIGFWYSEGAVSPIINNLKENNHDKGQ